MTYIDVVSVKAVQQVNGCRIPQTHIEIIEQVPISWINLATYIFYNRPSCFNFVCRRVYFICIELFFLLFNYLL